MNCRKVVETCLSASKNEAVDPSLESFLCSQLQYSYLCPVSPSFYSDDSNLYGICANASELHEFVSYIFKSRSAVSDSFQKKRDLEREALDIYTTIHRRYVQSDEGLRVLVNRFKGGDFGKCHCWRCEYTCLLPVGLSHERNVSSVKLFCPCCKEIYNPSAPYDLLDGAFFGREMASLFLTHYPDLVPTPKPKYQPAIFGYKIHPSSPYYLNSKRIAFDKED